MASWTDALKEYAKVKGQFIVPKKDSEDYKAVKELQSKMKPKVAEPAPEEHPVTKAKIERRKKQVQPEGVLPPTEEAPKKAPAKKHAIQPEVPRPAKPVAIAAVATVTEEAPKRRVRKTKGEVTAPAEATPAAPAAAPKRARKERAVKVEIEQKPTVLTF